MANLSELWSEALHALQAWDETAAITGCGLDEAKEAFRKLDKAVARSSSAEEVERCLGSKQHKWSQIACFLLSMRDSPKRRSCRSLTDQLVSKLGEKCPDFQIAWQEEISRKNNISDNNDNEEEDDNKVEDSHTAAPSGLKAGAATFVATSWAEAACYKLSGDGLVSFAFGATKWGTGAVGGSALVATGAGLAVGSAVCLLAASDCIISRQDGGNDEEPNQEPDDMMMTVMMHCN
eukprot:TRINITY_DN8709_c0_g1_i2.p1 TRINITY_DN8709_c0_g1~~TRINITY_DN8709_c0_g1_i2.p1  ORF type:complete len:235 (-),score=62.48 TRINITY_DN8709_c0_g1_i2:209-913(-)